MSLMRQTKRKQATDSMRTQIANLANLVRLRDETITYERAQRVAAQRGLLPYVRAIQRFNEWVQAHRSPMTKTQVVTALKDLGIYGIKVGYDPDDGDPEIQAAISAGLLPPPLT